MWQQMGWVAKGVAFSCSSCRCGRSASQSSAFSPSRKRAISRRCTRRKSPSTSKKGVSRTRSRSSSSKNFRYSHLAKVVLAGLQEYQFQQESGGGLSREDLMDTVRRSIQRASALTASDLKKGSRRSPTIGSTAPFVGLLGTVVGVITAFQASPPAGRADRRGVGRNCRSAGRNGARLVVAIPAVWFYNYLTGRIEYFNVEMDNSSSELVDYFIKKTRVTGQLVRQAWLGQVGR
jgi:biopolymer transport protein ExbB/biopolymer transport protein TolQ